MKTEPMRSTRPTRRGIASGVSSRGPAWLRLPTAAGGVRTQRRLKKRAWLHREVHHTLIQHACRRRPSGSKLSRVRHGDILVDTWSRSTPWVTRGVRDASSRISPCLTRIITQMVSKRHHAWALQLQSSRQQQRITHVLIAGCRAVGIGCKACMTTSDGAAWTTRRRRGSTLFRWHGARAL